MKKIIGVLGVAVIAATMFFSANNMNYSSFDASLADTSLADIIAVNTANAEADAPPTYWVKKHITCSITIQGKVNHKITVWGVEYTIPSSGSITVSANVGVDCDSNGPSQCTVFDCNEMT